VTKRFSARENQRKYWNRKTFIV